MGNQMTPSHLTLSDLERSKSRPLRFRRTISRKGVELGNMLPLNINRKAFMGSPFGAISVYFSDLERSVSRSLRF